MSYKHKLICSTLYTICFIVILTAFYTYARQNIIYPFLINYIKTEIIQEKTDNFSVSTLYVRQAVKDLESGSVDGLVKLQIHLNNLSEQNKLDNETAYETVYTKALLQIKELSSGSTINTLFKFSSDIIFADYLDKLIELFPQVDEIFKTSEIKDKANERLTELFNSLNDKDRYYFTYISLFKSFQLYFDDLYQIKS